MRGTTTRILILAALALVVHLGAAWMQAGLKPAKVAPPDRNIHDLPLQFDEWMGKEFDLQAENPELWKRLEAHDAIDRKYRNDMGDEISLHCAVFTEYDIGAFHLPTNCYGSQGWRMADEELLELETPNGAIAVSLTTWELEGEEPAMACYWYQLDEHVVLSRLDLGKTRLTLRGREVWPPLIKVLITGTASEPQKCKEHIRAFSQWACTWINQPVEDLGSESPTEYSGSR